MRVTIKAINAAVAPFGYELVKGNGYFYFWPLDINKSKMLYDDSVCTNRLTSMTVEQWVSELEYKLADCRNL